LNVISATEHSHMNIQQSKIMVFDQKRCSNCVQKHCSLVWQTLFVSH